VSLSAGTSSYSGVASPAACLPAVQGVPRFLSASLANHPRFLPAAVLPGTYVTGSVFTGCSELTGLCQYRGSSIESIAGASMAPAKPATSLASMKRASRIREECSNPCNSPGTTKLGRKPLRSSARVEAGESEARLALGRLATAKRTTLQIPSSIPLQTWCRIGEQIMLLRNSSAWWLGDWIVYGQDEFGDRYKRAIEETSLNYQTLRNYAWVARRFAPYRRRDGLSFQHHAEVASLSEPEQELWLDRALTFHWTLAEFRRQLKASAPDPFDPDVPPPIKLMLSLTVDKRQRWQAAADAEQRALIDWITSAIDRAAEHVLTNRRPGFAMAGTAAATASDHVMAARRS
jgi:hypothetical protein